MDVNIDLYSSAPIHDMYCIHHNVYSLQPYKVSIYN